MELRPLLQILSDGYFHSGEQIGRSLAISRTAVWKQINRLREIGVEVHSVTGKGYRLPMAMCLLDRHVILALLGPDASHWESRLYLTFSTSSTNIDAMKYAQRGADSIVCIAEHQSEGRGRRGREWQSPLGCNISLSMLESFRSGAGALDGLSLAVAVMVVDALNESGYSGFKLKWPNDVFLDGKKLAGILLELTGDVSGPCKVVIGVGINTQMPATVKSRVDQPVIDLAEKFVVPPDRNLIVANLIRNLSAGLAVFGSEGFIAFKERWELLDLYRGKQVRLGAGVEAVEGLVQGVDGRGALLLKTGDNVRAINGGELFPSLRPL